MVLPLPLLLLLLVLMMGGRVTVRDAAADLPPTFGPHSYEVRSIIKVLTVLVSCSKKATLIFVVGFQFKAPIVLARIRICIRMYVGGEIVKRRREK